MNREHNLTIDTIAASRGKRITNNVNDSSANNKVEGKEENRILEDFDDDDDDDFTSSPSVIDEEINYDLVYAFHNFTATVEGQTSVEKGEPLVLLDDSNSYWWLVKVLRNEEVGYIPAENVEASSSQNNSDRDYSLDSKDTVKKQKGVKFKSMEFITRIEYEEEDEEEVLDFSDYEEMKDSSDSKEQKDEAVDGHEEPVLERRESVESVLTESSTSTTTTTASQEVNVVTAQKPGIIIEVEQTQQKVAVTSVQPTEINSSTEQTNYYPRSDQKESSTENNNVKQTEPVNPIFSSENIFDQSSETIKMSLTPALGSDFIDFSDDEDEEPKQKTGNKFFGKGDNDSSKVNNSSSNNNKPVTTDKKTKSSKKDEDSSKQSTNLNNRAYGRQQLPPSQLPQSINVQPSVQPSAQKMVQQQQVTNSIQSRASSSSQQSVNMTTIQQQLQSARPGQPPTRIPSPPKSTPPSPTQTQQHSVQPNQSLNSTAQQSIGSRPTEKLREFETRRPNSLMIPANSAYSVVRIFAGQHISSKVEYKIVLLSQVTNTISLIKQALKRFNLDSEDKWDDYYITIKESDREPHHLMPHDYPLEIFETLTSSYLTPLPTVKRASISSVSSNFSNLSTHEAISKLLFRDDKNLVCLYLNKKLKTDGKTNSMEPKFRVRVLVYSDDLPAHLRHKGTVPRVSMSVPKHLVEKAARRKSREEGKPREKAVNVTGKTRIGQIVEKAMFKFGISDGIVDDGKPILGSDDGKPRYYLTMIVDGEEKYLRPETNVMSFYKPPSDLRHFSIDSLDSTSSSTFDYHPDEPIFVLRLLRPEDRQKRAMPQTASEDIKRYTQNVNLTQNLGDMNSTPMPSVQLPTSDNAAEGAVTENAAGDQLSRKKLIEQQREYSRAKQRSILAARKNEEQGIDIITRAGAIRSSRIFGAQVRYSFISADGEQVDISDLIEDVWGDDELAAIPEDSLDYNDQSQNESSHNDVDNTLSNKRASRRKSRTAEVDILENIVKNGENGDDADETETIEQRINRVIQKVKAGQYGRGEIPSFSAAVRNKNAENRSPKLGENREQLSPVSTPVQQSPNISSTPNRLSNDKRNSVISNDESFELDANKDFKDGGAFGPIPIDESSNSPNELPEPELISSMDLERPASSVSNRSASTTNSESVTPTKELFTSTPLRTPSTKSPIPDSDWILSDEFGLQELLVLVRSGVNMLEIKERRRSGWNLNDDPEKILEQISPSEIREEIKDVFAGVNDELDKMELQQIKIECNILPRLIQIANPPWVSLPGVDAPVSFSYSTSVVSPLDNSTIYLIGGTMTNPNTNAADSSSAVYALDTVNKKWRTLNSNASDLMGRTGIEGVVDNTGEVYIFGGNSNSTLHNGTNILNLNTDAWTNVQQTSQPASFEHYAAILLENGIIVYIGGAGYITKDGQIVIYGGTDVSFVLVTPELSMLNTSIIPYNWYSPIAQTDPNSPPSLAKHSATMYGDLMITAFGFIPDTLGDTKNLNTKVYIFDTTNYSWVDSFIPPSPTSTFPSTPNASNAKFSPVTSTTPSDNHRKLGGDKPILKIGGDNEQEVLEIPADNDRR
ncbi:5722_t:CDS:10 [Acaulospora colombiana]|uniref:5722_t:CDS:1 n=1 Tax=Acaulospora colombiana TaxID=27376 RepID=A0ACA9KD57_9GLOM|nr:5722_t:CDS:10 [Acaulospora colombiana]